MSITERFLLLFAGLAGARRDRRRFFRNGSTRQLHGHAENLRLFPMVAPIGGSAMIFGWVFLVLAALIPRRL